MIAYGKAEMTITTNLWFGCTFVALLNHPTSNQQSTYMSIIKIMTLLICNWGLTINLFDGWQ